MNHPGPGGHAPQKAGRDTDMVSEWLGRAGPQYTTAAPVNVEKDPINAWLTRPVPGLLSSLLLRGMLTPAQRAVEAATYNTKLQT